MVAALLVCAVLAGAPAGATPVIATNSSNVTRLAQARWIMGSGNDRIRWTLDARQYTDVRAWGVPDASSGIQLILVKEVFERTRSTATSRGWPLTEKNFVFDPLLREVRVNVPGKMHVRWTATGGHQLVTARQARPGVYDDPSDFLGADIDADAVAALRRPARLTGRVKSYPGRIKTKGEIYLWAGSMTWAGVCALDQGYPCL